MRKTFTHDGTRYEVTADTLEELGAKIALKRRDLVEGKITVNGNTKVSDWVDKYLAMYREDSVKQVTYRNIKSKANHNIKSEIGSMMVKDVRPIHCQKIANNLKGCSEDHIKKVMQLLSDIFEKAKDNKMILDNPAANLKKPQGYKHSLRAITDNERKVILKVAETHIYGLWILTMLYCGLRPAETALIQGRHIDRKKSILKVEGTKTANAKRNIPIPETIIDRFPKLEPFQYLFTNANGNRLTESNRRSMWERFERDMNIAMGCEVFRNEVKKPYRVADDLVPYCLRHTFCTDLQDAGVPINVAKDLMGHSDISLTARIYTHRTDTSFNNAAELINKYHSPKDEKDNAKNE